MEPEQPTDPPSGSGGALDLAHRMFDLAREAERATSVDAVVQVKECPA